MTPILFDKNETAFTGNGLGRLTDCTRCEVTEERNGVYEVEFDYPMSGAMFSQITEGRYIYTTHDESKAPQPFEIYFRSAPLEGVVTFRAWHISYMLNNVIAAPFTAASAAGAMAAIPTHSITANPFTFWTDKEVSGSYTLSTPRAVRAVLGGAEGSLLDVYGKGDYEFDLWTVKLHRNRGTNSGVSIRYGKNLVSLNQERDASAMYSGLIPYWQDVNGENVVYLDHAIYRTGETSGRVVTIDLSSDFEEQPTAAQLEARAQTIIDGSDAYELKENLTIDFVALWQTEEYKDVANLQRIRLCDTVNIFYSKLGINATAKCIKVVYDSLAERYKSLELGTPRTTLAQQILETTASTLLRDVPSKSVMQSAIDKATEMIAGGFGGYIKFNYLSDGTPSEMLIMNTPDEATATNIIRLNQNGIGFSTDGGTTYRNAWTIDGNLNADFINAGTLSGVRVEAESGNIGRWEINTSALYKDVQGQDGYVYRTYFQPPLASGVKTWVLSCQKSQTQGNVGDSLMFNGIFVLYSDGSAKFGDTNISAEGVIDAKTLNTADANITGGQISIVTASELTSVIRLAHGNSYIDITPTQLKLLSSGGVGIAAFFSQSEDSRTVMFPWGFRVQLPIDDFNANAMELAKDYFLLNDVTATDHTLRTELDKDGLSFYDATGNATTSYPATIPAAQPVSRRQMAPWTDYSHYQRYGNLVIVHFAGGIASGTADGDVIAYNLPPAISEAYGAFAFVSSQRALVSISGTNMYWRDATTSADANAWGQIVYLTTS